MQEGPCRKEFDHAVDSSSKICLDQETEEGRNDTVLWQVGLPLLGWGFSAQKGKLPLYQMYQEHHKDLYLTAK